MQPLLNELEITKQLGRFARIIDGKRFEDADQIFAEDVSFDYGLGQEERGLAALKHLFERFLEKCGPTQHLMGSIIVEVNGSSATSHCYVQARHQRSDDYMGPIQDSNGKYADTWQKLPQGWRIVYRKVLWSAFTGDPAILAELADGLPDRAG